MSFALIRRESGATASPSQADGSEVEMDQHAQCRGSDCIVFAGCVAGVAGASSSATSAANEQVARPAVLHMDTAAERDLSKDVCGNATSGRNTAAQHNMTLRIPVDAACTGQPSSWSLPNVQAAEFDGPAPGRHFQPHVTVLASFRSYNEAESIAKLKLLASKLKVPLACCAAVRLSLLAGHQLGSSAPL
jgi:hypothetical protein